MSAGSLSHVDPSAIKALKWRLVGPFRGGRVVAVSGDPVNPQIFYFGSTGGGVWKTYDGGRFWDNVSDGFFKRASVGGIAVAPSDPNVIYVGMGESTIRGNVSHGDGVYKSTDAGKTWTHLGLEKTRNIGKVRVHPDNPDIVYVAAFGHAHGPNPERGVYRSKDGGATWEQVLFKSDKAGANDLTIDPTNPRIIYATVWEAIRRPWEMVSGGEDSGIWRSFDGGDTWDDISHNDGLPKGVLGKIGISASGAQPGRVLAMVEAEDGAVFRSDDYGDTWQRGSEDRNLRQRAWYYHHIIADPQNADAVWVLNVEAWKSIDGGNTFQVVAVPHGDNHDLWIDPHEPAAHDPGQRRRRHRQLQRRPIMVRHLQPADGRVLPRHHRQPSPLSRLRRAAGQHHDHRAQPLLDRRHHARRGVRGRRRREWLHRSSIRDDPNIIYAGSYGGYLTRFDRATGEHRMINVWPENTLGSGAEAAKYRFQWTSPIVISPHDPDVMYVTSQHVHPHDRRRDRPGKSSALT